MLITEIPTRFVATDLIKLRHFEIHPGRKVKVRRDSNMHLGRTVMIQNISDEGKYNDWIYFHALISKSDELVDYYFNPSGYRLEGDLSDSQSSAISKDAYLNEPELLNYIFGIQLTETKTYEELYESFLGQDPVVLDALRNYYFANSLSGNTSKHIDISYWQIVIYMSVIETLMGEQPQCRNKNTCRICKNGLESHNLISSGEWFNERLFSKIKNDDNRSQYKRIITECKYSIRNRSVHSSLLPVAESPKLADGSYYYDTNKMLEDYLNDANALKSLVKHMEELTRYYALNQIFDMTIYPELRGIQFGYLTLTTKNSAKGRAIFKQ